MSYFSNLQNIDELGLNDRRVARLPVTRIRFRGHVKHAPVSYMEERGVNLAFWHPDYHSCSSPPERDFPSVFIRVDEKRCVRARYLVQSAKLTELFCAHRGQFVLSGLVCPDALPVPSLTEGYESIAQVVYREGHYIDGTAFRFDVHDPDWVTTGEAFEGWPSAPSSAQGSIYGPIGGFLNSFHPTKGDRARGSIESPPFDIIGDVLVLRVGGGNLEAKLYVELLIEGKRVARITGNNTKTLQPHFIDVAAHKGKVGVLKVVDQVAGSFGHIMVDEVVQWRRAVPGPT